MLPLKAEGTPDYLSRSKKCNHGEKELVRQVGGGRRSGEEGPRRAVFRLQLQQLGCAEQAAHRHLWRSQLLRLNDNRDRLKAVPIVILSKCSTLAAGLNFVKGRVGEIDIPGIHLLFTQAQTLAEALEVDDLTLS